MAFPRDQATEPDPEGSPKHVRAAGGIVHDGHDSIAMVYRPIQDDWSLPKGKLEPGERRVDAALREVLEETGLSCGIVGHAADVSYIDRKGRPKSVRYYQMVVLGGEFVVNDETTELRWINQRQIDQLTYEADRALVTDMWPNKPTGQ